MMDESLLDWPLMVVDTETDGLPDDPDARVIEVGAVVIDRAGVELAAFSSLVRPRYQRWSDPGVLAALAVNGITQTMLEEAPHCAAVDKALRAWMQLTYRRPRLTSWRTSFDRLMMSRSLPVTMDWDWTRCIHQVAKRELGMMDHKHGPKLDIVAEYFGIAVEPTTRHRALNDARLAARVAVALEATSPAPLFRSPPAHLTYQVPT